MRNVRIYNAERSYMIWERFWDFKFKRSSLELFRMHIWFAPLLAYVVSQCICSSYSFTALSIFWWGFVEHLLDPAVYLCKVFFFFKVLVSSIDMVIQMDLSHWQEFWIYLKLIYDFEEFCFLKEPLQYKYEYHMWSLYQIRLKCSCSNKPYSQRHYCYQLCQHEPKQFLV